MNIVLVGIDSKYIHTNMALRYLKAHLDQPSELLEFTIKDDLAKIENSILAKNPDVIGLSVYLWNVKMMMALTVSIKAKCPAVIIMGGPEVSYEPDYFMNAIPVDYIIAGEGENAFKKLISSLANPPIDTSIEGLVYRDSKRIVIHKTALVKDLDALSNPYHFEADLSNLSSRIQYIETSRGCPYHCSYCLASLENSVRFFNIDRVKEDILYLMVNGAKTFKFLDRTFNFKVSYALELFKFIIDHHFEGTVFQFEITGDLLPVELIEYLNHHAPKGLFRFEIGVQSTHLATNLSVDRHQNTEKLLSNIRLIQEAGIIDLHLDLIAGLPEENLERFAITFDEVFSLYPKELQLGFLKMLRGTKIRREATKYGYVYDDKPPYEIIRNNSLSESDLSEIHLTEEVLEIFWNKGYMPESMLLFIKSGRSAFASMNAFAHHLVDTSFDFHRFQLADLFERLHAYAQIRYPESSQILFDSLKFEYLLRSRIKPKIWWDNSIEKANKNSVLRRFQERHTDLKIDDLYKYAVVTAYQDKSLIVMYRPDNMTYYTE